MQVKIKRIDASLPMPHYATAGACCFDLFIRERTVVSAKQLGVLPTNIIIAVPEEYMFLIVPRSSTPKKKGLLIPHGIGIIDQDYNGPEDEVLFQVFNFTDKEVIVEKGERIAQGCLVPIARAEFVEVKKVGEKTRGGIGSTG